MLRKPSPRRGQPLGMVEMRVALSAMAGLLLHRMAQVTLDPDDVAWRIAVVRGALAGVTREELRDGASTAVHEAREADAEEDRLGAGSAGPEHGEHD